MQNKVDVAVMIGSGVPETLRALGQKACWVKRGGAQWIAAGYPLEARSVGGRREVPNDHRAA